MKIFNFGKLGLALFVLSILFNCSDAENVPAWRDGYIKGNGNDIGFYVYMSETDTFYNSPTKNKIALQPWSFTNTNYKAISMSSSRYADDVDYIQITLNTNTTNDTYSAEFTPNETLFGSSTVIRNNDNNILTITYPENLPRDAFIGMLKVSFSSNGTLYTDYYDIYNSDDVNAIFD